MFLKRLRIPALLAAGALALAGCTPSTDEAASDPTSAPDSSVTVGLTYIPNVQFAPTYVAADEGFFKDAGADVTIRHHGADEGLFTALMAGEEDVVIATGDEMLIARSQGMDLVSVGQYYAKYPVTIIVPEDSDVQSFTGLKGKTVGLPGEFGSNWYGLLVALDAFNMTRNDIDIASIGFTQLSALQSGQVDAVVGFSNNDSVQFELAGFATREISLVPEGDMPLIGANVVTTAQFADEHPEAVSAVLSGLNQGKQVCVEDPDRAVEITKNYDTNLSSPGAVDAAKATLLATNELFSLNGVITMEQDIDTWEKMAEFLATQDGLLGAEVNVEEAVTNEFVE